MLHYLNITIMNGIYVRRYDNLVELYLRFFLMVKDNRVGVVVVFQQHSSLSCPCISMNQEICWMNEDWWFMKHFIHHYITSCLSNIPFGFIDYEFLDDVFICISVEDDVPSSCCTRFHQILKLMYQWISAISCC